jgi:hypothetical protein
MTAMQRFCEECGKPLAPSMKFCEECGCPVAGIDTPVQPGPAPSTPPATDNVALAVIPFAYQSRGAFSIERMTIVVYPDQVILASIPKHREEEFDQAMIEVQATLMEKHLAGKSFWQLATGTGFALFKLAWSPVDFYTADAVKEERMLRTSSIQTRPWERYLSMPPDAVLAENKRNRAIPRESIAFIRGESDPSTSTDQILIYHTGGCEILFFDFGIFHLARKVLFSFLFPGPLDHETIIGVIPYADEPEVEGFGFQYTWNVVVTENRLIFCMIEDEYADEAAEWINARTKETKKTGRKLREGDLAGVPDAPWQRFMKRSVSSLLENEVNFFIPLSIIQSVELVPGSPGQADELCIYLPGQPYDIIFTEGTAGHIQTVLGTVLAGRMK